MLYSIPTTRMLQAARSSLELEKRKRSPSFDIFMFLLVTLVCSLIQNTVSALLVSFYAFRDPQYVALMESVNETMTVDTEALTAFYEDFTNRFLTDTPPAFYIVLIASSGIMIVASVIFCVLIQKRNTLSMGLSARLLLPDYLIGLGVGALAIALPTLICIITNCVTLVPNKSVNALNIALFFLAFVLQGLGEEVLFRGYLMPTLARRTHVWVAIIFSSLIFSIFHINNASFSFIAFINITLFGIFASVVSLKRGSIWLSAAIHTAWNFMQGNIFGFNVSGTSGYDTVITATPKSIGTILSGGKFGLEGGLGVTVVLLIMILCALMLKAKTSELCEEPTEAQPSNDTQA